MCVNTISRAKHTSANEIGAYRGVHRKIGFEVLKARASAGGQHFYQYFQFSRGFCGIVVRKFVSVIVSFRSLYIIIVKL